MFEDFNKIRFYNTNMQAALKKAEEAEAALKFYQDFFDSHSDSSFIPKSAKQFLEKIESDISMDLSDLKEKLSEYLKSLITKINKHNSRYEELSQLVKKEILETIASNGQENLYVFNDLLIRSPKFYESIHEMAKENDHLIVKILYEASTFGKVRYHVVFWDKEKYPSEHLEKYTIPIKDTALSICWNDNGDDFASLTELYSSPLR